MCMGDFSSKFFEKKIFYKSLDNGAGCTKVT